MQHVFNAPGLRWRARPGIAYQILGAVAEFERALIRERTRAGLKAARERGRIGGNLGLRLRSSTTSTPCSTGRQQPGKLR